jgi:hypothetical protein
MESKEGDQVVILDATRLYAESAGPAGLSL